MCDSVWLGICFNSPVRDDAPAIFGFAEFGTAIALLTLVYSSSDPLYRFRTAVAPIPLVRITFGSTAAIGVGALLTDLWFANHWPAPALGINRPTIQGMLGFWFLAVVLTWTWFAFIRPPVFGRLNALRYARALFQIVLRGNDAELAVVAREIVRSSRPLLQHTLQMRPRPDVGNQAKPSTNQVAYQTLMILANRKLCRHIVASSPGTAIALAEDAVEFKKFAAPLGAFFGNVTAEAILNSDSIIFHEDSYSGGMLGHLQPFTKAIYGNYALVEGTADGINSALDLQYDFAYRMTSPQWEAYCRLALITFKHYIQTDAFRGHSFVLTRALHAMSEYALHDLYTLNGQENAYDSEPLRRLSAVMTFANDLLELLSKKEIEADSMRIKKSFGTIHDQVAEFLFEVLRKVIHVKGPPSLAWQVHYNGYWSRLWTFRTRNKTVDAIRIKLSRLIYDEIKQLEKFPNFESSKFLGFALNVLGLRVPTKEMVSDWWMRPLHKSVLKWTEQNYLRLREVHPPVAADCLSGSVSYDTETGQIIKTYATGLRLTPNVETLPLARST